MSHLTTSSLIFDSAANHNFSQILTSLKRSTLSIHNRLHSIQQDSAFVLSVSAAYNAPLIANERCGSWYIGPSSKAGSAYFKSTDGHTGIWFFSTRRLNFQLLDVLAVHGKAIIVDSTRRGKSMPDALSKTIPIWACVLNRALFADDPAAHDLYTPPSVVSPSEHAQILARIPALLDSFLALDLDLPALRKKLSLPLRPVWVTPESSLDIDPHTPVFETFTPLICCTSSRRIAGAEGASEGYIQGAADDTENWAGGLTPDVFWENEEMLLALPEEELPGAIKRLIGEHAAVDRELPLPEPITPDGSLVVAVNDALLAAEVRPGDVRVVLLPDASPRAEWVVDKSSLTVGLGAHKIGSRNLRTVLPVVVEFLRGILAKQRDQTRILISCASGKDAAVGVALAVLCLFYDEGERLYAWERVNDGKGKGVDKGFIKQRLSWLMVEMPHVNPSRATLQSVNSFLMERPS